MIKTLKEHVAIEPVNFNHDSGSPQKLVTGFVATDKLSKSLISSKVVFDSERFSAGDIVYFKADAVYNNPANKIVYTVEGREFNLIPESSIICYKRANNV